jgi:hypothetical protein
MFISKSPSPAYVVYAVYAGAGLLNIAAVPSRCTDHIDCIDQQYVLAFTFLLSMLSMREQGTTFPLTRDRDKTELWQARLPASCHLADRRVTW